MMGVNEAAVVVASLACGTSRSGHDSFANYFVTGPPGEVNESRLGIRQRLNIARNRCRRYCKEPTHPATRYRPGNPEVDLAPARLCAREWLDCALQGADWPRWTRYVTHAIGCPNHRILISCSVSPYVRWASDYPTTSWEQQGRVPCCWFETHRAKQ